MLVLLLFCLACSVYYVWCRRSRSHLYELCRDVPNVGSLPLLGHTHWFIGGQERSYYHILTWCQWDQLEGMLDNMKRLVAMIDEAGGVGQVWIGPELHLVITNPEDAKTVLANCLEKNSSYKFIKSWFGNGLFVAPVETWKNHRRVMLPIFQNRQVENYIDIFGQHAAILAEKLAERAGGAAFNIFDYINACTLDIVFETSTGEHMSIQTQHNTRYVRSRSTVMSIINARIYKAWLNPDWLFNLTTYSGVLRHAIGVSREFTNNVIRKKRAVFQQMQTAADSEGSIDMLSQLLHTDAVFTDEQLREHIDAATIAGNDTLALIAAYALTLLGANEQAQERVCKELKTIFGDSSRSPTKEDLLQMEYLERVLKETMRLYSVVPVIGRTTDRELQLSTCKVPAGVDCEVVLFAIHNSRRVWGDDVEQFQPDRFLPEWRGDRPDGYDMTFSYGPRNCIGRHYAMLAMKSIITNILMKYRVKAKVCERLKVALLVHPVDGHMVTLETR